ncbi:GntR family transcriptional regulator [Clostridium sporogenes]|uniref:GntR family transcriptional regulator n=1 Tax=Clostridium sporogenes TaxID=1509 RepID=A0A7X5P7V8_CLOSG|nr:GntR family transcriptional regulator [Clostridium sporogenes]AJD32580.1 bacterial regulatory s, gntR family protein [Clostridium botulinum Prevot_594]AVP59539.1 GntR family transcriptional regulator [Clostridium botulinum]AKC62063.1 GntR family transcriptional regulator [Clostridium sporogenes]AKJ89352.1 GntR family transcriptional regulator [Clostridium sporogenes]EHN13881.1 GntR family transcriptional regulator [Clostridium sporogenes PA 3679]
MILQIDFESQIPIYEQLKRQIIQGIAKGYLKPNDPLPSVRQMAEDIGINLHTVNKAYNILKSEGYVTIDRRVGAVISSNLPKKTDEYKNNLKEELKYMTADAHCRGFSKEDFLKFCEDILKEYE